jgi:hypothetical protein
MYSSETSVDTQWTTRRHIPEHDTLHRLERSRVSSSGTTRRHIPEDNTLHGLERSRVSSSGTTRRHIPEDDTLHNHRCENLKSYIERSNLNFHSTVHGGSRKNWLVV